MSVSSGFADVPGGNLYYEIRGAGPPVVLLHSGLVDSRMWDAQMEAFARSFRVLRYDLRGFGRSSSPTAPFSHVEDLDALLRHLGIGRAALVGISFGGRIAIDFTLDHPDKVSALVSVAATPSGYRDWSQEVRDLWAAMEAAIKERDVRRAQKMEMDLWIPAGRFPDTDPFLWRVAAENEKVLRDDPDLERAPERSAVGRLHEIRVPTLVVLAERDLRDVERCGDLLVAEVVGAQKVIVPRTDHLVNVRNPEGFNLAVLRFLEKAVAV